MARYNFTAHAAADLRNIIRHTRHTRQTWSLKQARHYRQELELSLKRLAELPGMGRKREEIAPGVRSFRVAEHIACFTSRKGGITILRLLHPSMDVDLAFEEKPEKEAGK